MEAPKCRSCGERHWERLCPKVFPRPETKTVTKRVTPFTSCPECAKLRAEVDRLKRALMVKRALAAITLQAASHDAVKAESVTNVTSVTTTKGVTKPVTKPVTKLFETVTKLQPVTKPGRPAVGDKAMTAAERAKRYRVARAAIATPATDKALRKRYQRLGAKAHDAGVKREDCPVDGLIKQWWLDGWDGKRTKENR